ncbi:excisionase family DNA binding domain-containing [Bacillus sp. OxB-1]|uniref:excisionase family DNA-binding protein n=1 Tax=Bacillus sp. (strain OxB-1) TaxID=98228 RepID=UPI0005822EAC|nr:excisionase family DNA-binding protein [Bacillus sp. OxB-1]BAQ09681.1 excisionase family DNA binding domain-containing [Bacillus sp. OxB-1]
MYRTVEETAEYLGMPVEQVEKYILDGRIRAVHDGDQFLVNQAQFSLYFEQLETAKQLIEDYWSEPLPPDPDIKDED